MALATFEEPRAPDNDSMTIRLASLRCWRALALLAALHAVAGCAAVHRPPATAASLERDAVAARDVEQATTDTIVSRLARRALARGDRTVDILLLSGGGQGGAYGAGFLRGWKARTEAPMPTFDLVSGISTGALQAPFALLGTDAALDTVAALYRRAAESIAPTIDWLFWLRRTGGLVKTKRLERTIASAIDTAMQGALQRAFGEGRQLVIGTTDFDLGIGRTWDMSGELAGGAAALRRAHTLFLAASAIPGIFPPKVIDGRVHADGGVVSNVHPVLALSHYERLAQQVRALGFKEPVTVRLWVVMNLWTQLETKVVDPASRGGMHDRAFLLLFWTQQPQFLQRLTELARAVNSDVDGLRMELRFTTMPAALASDPAAKKLFDRDFMLRLERLGYERAQGPSPWDAAPPTPYQRWQ